MTQRATYDNRTKERHTTQTTKKQRNNETTKFNDERTTCDNDIYDIQLRRKRHKRHNENERTTYNDTKKERHNENERTTYNDTK